MTKLQLIDEVKDLKETNKFLQKMAVSSSAEETHFYYKDLAEVYMGDVRRLKRLLGMIEGMCGNPDAAEACRLILKMIDKELRDDRQQ